MLSPVEQNFFDSDRSILTSKYRYSSRNIAGSIRAWHARPRLVQVYVNKWFKYPRRVVMEPPPSRSILVKRELGSVLAIYYLNIMCINRMTNTHTTHTNISNIPVFTNIYICNTCYPWCFIGITLRGWFDNLRMKIRGQRKYQLNFILRGRLKCYSIWLFETILDFKFESHRSHLSICLVSVVQGTRERAEHETNKCKCLQINPVRVWTDFNQ